MKTSGITHHSGTGTGECNDNNVGDLIGRTKNSHSDQVSLPGSSSKRHIGAAALMPFSSGRRALPSKWDDAERWITSPASSQGGYRRKSLDHPQRKLKSKSGPVGQTGLVYFPYFLAPVLAQSGSITKNSPLATGVFLPDPSLSLHFGAGNAANNLSWSGDVPSLSDLNSGGSDTDPIDGDTVEEEVPVPQRDVVTQMCPQSPSKDQVFKCIQPSSLSPAPEKENPATEVIRDVQVDQGTPNTGKQSKRRGIKKIMVTKKTEHLTSKWSSSEVSQKLSKLQREEAKISAWESLQKAKAETAMRKLEMQLEKKRSASMDRISHKLRRAQTKAEAKRNLLSMDDPAVPFRGCKYFTMCFATRGSP